MTDHSVAATLPSGPFRFIALDVETASRDSASICQIGIACVCHDNHIRSFTTYVNPEQSFAPFNTELHGIDAQTVATAPRFPEAWTMLKPLLELHHLVQHSSFDSRAISAACRAYRMPNADLSWSDSVKIARNCVRNGVLGFVFPDEFGEEIRRILCVRDMHNLDFAISNTLVQACLADEKVAGSRRRFGLLRHALIS